MTPAERLRQHQRTLQKAQRELDRERTKLESQVSYFHLGGRYTDDITDATISLTGKETDDGYQEECESWADGQFAVRRRALHSIRGLKLMSFSIQSAAKIQAKDLVRTRRYIQKFTQMKVQLQAVSLRMQALRSNEQMAVAMKGATRVSWR